MDDATPRVSVIVPAHDAAATLGDTLEALGRQSLAPYEVIVVDDGSTDATAEVAGAAGDGVTVIRQPRLGAGAARNRGVEEARGGVLAFTDADCSPEPNWLASGLSCLEEADLAQGAVGPPPGVAIGPFDRTLFVRHENGLYQSANLFVRRELFERIGGFVAVFEPEIGRPFGEDVAFGWRARRAGARTRFCSRAVVRHAVFRGGPSGYVTEHLRRGYFAGLVGAVPELRPRFFFARFFLSRRTAAFDLALLGAVGATALWSPLPLLAAIPYLALSAKDAARWRSWAPALVAIGVAADGAGLLSLLRGSLRWRRLVL
jgi:hypothetical protein